MKTQELAQKEKVLMAQYSSLQDSLSAMTAKQEQMLRL